MLRICELFAIGGDILQKSNAKYNFLYLIPIAFITSIIPWIVYLKKIKLNKFLLTYWTGKEFNWDYFSYYKSIWLLIFTFIAIIILFIYILRKKKFTKTYYYIPLGIYAFFITLSSFFSEYRLIALWGFPDRYEGMFVLLAYVIVTIITINLVNDTRDIKFLVGCLLTSASLLGVFGILQYFGFDFFRTLKGQLLILPERFHYLAGEIGVDFGPNIIYSTLYNPNYVGSYMVMLFGFSFVLYLFTEDKKYKLLLGVVNVLMFANWLGSLSRAGIIGGFFAFLLLVLLFHKRLINDWQYLLGIFLCFVLVFGIMNYASQGDLVREVFSLGQEAQMAFGEGEVSNLKDIKINGRELSIITESERINIVAQEDNSLVFYDGGKAQVPYSYKKYPDPYVAGKYVKRVNLHSEQYKNYTLVVVPHKNILHFEYNKLFGDRRMGANFKITSKGFRIKGIKDKLYKLQKVESWGFENKERLGSGRGFIWSRSLPLLTNTLITGYGPDTFALYFPQHDFVGKLKTYGKINHVVDKPHNMFLQIAINTGIISLLAVIILFTGYFFSSIRLYWNLNLNNTYTIVGAGILIAFTGYVVASLFNDSVVSVAPVFWSLLGMGISINMKLKQTVKEVEK